MSNFLPKFGHKSTENRLGPKKPIGLWGSGFARAGFGLSLRPDPSLIPNTFVEKVTQYICPFLYSTLYQFLRGPEGSHRLTTQKVSGSKPGCGRKNLFLFFQFFPGLSQNINKTQSWFSRYGRFFWQKK